MKPDPIHFRFKPLDRISECLRAQLTMRSAHRPAHSIGRPGCSITTNKRSTRPAAPFYLLVHWEGFENRKLVITINPNVTYENI